MYKDSTIMSFFTKRILSYSFCAYNGVKTWRFRLKVSLNHIHLVAKDKYQLFEWYQKYLGFEIVDDIEKLGEEGGPLFISSDNGSTAISIFTRKKATEFNVVCLPAFSTSAEDFSKCFIMFEGEDLQIYDHYIFFSFYPQDIMGNKLEISCLDYKKCKKILEEKKISYKKWQP